MWLSQKNKNNDEDGDNGPGGSLRQGRWSKGEAMAGGDELAMVVGGITPWSDIGVGGSSSYKPWSISSLAPAIPL